MATRRLEQAERTKETPARAGDVFGPFTLDEVKALVKVLEGTDVTSLRWDRNGQQIVIRRGQAGPVTQVVHQAAAAPIPLPAVVPGPTPASAPALAPVPTPKVEAKPGVLVTSPFVGTFYRAPSPDSPPFVEVGAIVKKGQSLCIVEAMKLMNEIEAEMPGKIAEILVANATPVEFGQVLFRIEPA
ncbi:MAG: acetyl-CoA carboxylase, biotin carboxyl carrier protein [Anaeromyxobacter sp. RBG_16_69_14]|nr:MAG: acetyl-CoA carboxylase, biotin carboxyl carrier protein [Anaeromyxobacter sp. RBG_16_69_14]